jgi:hypothetical protein
MHLPISTVFLNTYILYNNESLTNINHLKSLKKEPDVTQNGLATLQIQPSAHEVEQRSLHVYEEQLKAGDHK